MAVKTITLQVTRDFFKSFNGGPIYAAMQIVDKLRERGVPVLGSIVLEGVAHGNLSIVSSGEKIFYTWTRTPTGAPSIDVDPLNDEWDEDDGRL